jgi:hypothetical protein
MSSLLAEMDAGQSEYYVPVSASSAELCGSSASGAHMEFSNSGLDLEEMGSVLQQADAQSTLNNSIHFVSGPVKRGRPKISQSSAEGSLPKHPVGRPSTKPSKSSTSSVRPVGQPRSEVSNANDSGTSRHSLPPLRNPLAPRGPTYTSVIQWLHSDPEDPSAQPTSSTTGSILTDSTRKSEPLVRIIVAEPNENAVVGDDEGDDQNDAEDLPSSSSQTNTSSEQDDEPEKECRDFPDWFLKIVNEKLDLVSKQRDGKYVFYNETQSFWLPQKACWFRMLQTKTLGPEATYNPRFYFWDPLQLVKIKCPNFSNC